MKRKFLLFFLIAILINIPLVSFASEEIFISYNINKKLTFDEKSSLELKNLNSEFKKIVEENQGFISDFHLKLNKFINNNKHSLSALTALYMMSITFSLPETNVSYKKYNEQILQFIISNYPDSIQATVSKLALSMKENDNGHYNEALKILKDNYENILKASNDKYLQNFLDELGINNNITASYFSALAEIYYSMKNYNKATEYYQTIIDSFPNSKESKHAKLKIEAIKALTQNK